MWVVHEKLIGRSLRVIGPFNTAQEAAKWVDEKYTRKLGAATIIEKLTSPEEASQPNG